MALRIREIIVRAQVTGTAEDRIPKAAFTEKDSQDRYEPQTMAERFYEKDHSETNER